MPKKRQKPYALIDPEYHRPGYLGETDQDLAPRLNQHIYDARAGRGSRAKQEWLKELDERGLRPFIVELPMPLEWELQNPDFLRYLDQFSGEWVEELASIEMAEVYWIWRYKHAAGWKLLNESVGGPGQNGTTHTDEAKARISEGVRASKLRIVK